MKCNEETQNARLKVWGTQSCKENFSTKRKQSGGLGGKSEFTRDNSGGLNRSDWSRRDPFGFAGGEIINELIESIRADIEESQELVTRHSRKIEKLSRKLEDLKSLQSIQNEEIEKTEQNHQLTEEE